MFYCVFFFFQAEDGIRDLVRSRGLGDVYKRQGATIIFPQSFGYLDPALNVAAKHPDVTFMHPAGFCLLYTSDAADERSSVDLGGRRIIKKKKTTHVDDIRTSRQNDKKRLRTRLRQKT